MVTLIRASNPGRWTRRCNATCHNAKREKCVCICGGRYHGLKTAGAILLAEMDGPETAKALGVQEVHIGAPERTA